MEAMDWKAATDMLRAVAAAIQQHKDVLTEVDSKIGDGDHGIGMAQGMEKGLAKLDSLADNGNAYEPFVAFGKAMLLSMGGASGVLFGSLFMDGAKGQPPCASLSPVAFAEMMERALFSIKERGKAQVGDKTMVDALEPAVLAMKEHAAEGFGAMLAAGERAAAAGVEATKNQIARFGRAKSLMERALGFQDPGATSVQLIWEAMAGYAAQREGKPRP